MSLMLVAPLAARTGYLYSVTYVQNDVESVLCRENIKKLQNKARAPGIQQMLIERWGVQNVLGRCVQCLPGVIRINSLSLCTVLFQ
ncbi:hypothetical protein BCR43DRAFT_490230 [Syncephalastrum racemosum]|uniref:Uncharacterized protein n=1 Tax=Syncephalastrum racemosum TaxID=13706 RepID=A0A1X2HFM9_SYNRA|nr:hypothetical protein BCR43DRAFT_490230 [Syncephalastrum racemosum]